MTARNRSPPPPLLAEQIKSCSRPWCKASHSPPSEAEEGKYDDACMLSERGGFLSDGRSPPFSLSRPEARNWKKNTEIELWVAEKSHAEEIRNGMRNARSNFLGKSPARRYGIPSVEDITLTFCRRGRRRERRRVKARRDTQVKYCSPSSPGLSFPISRKGSRQKRKRKKRKEKKARNRGSGAAAAATSHKSSTKRKTNLRVRVSLPFSFLAGKGGEETFAVCPPPGELHELGRQPEPSGICVSPRLPHPSSVFAKYPHKKKTRNKIAKRGGGEEKDPVACGTVSIFLRCVIQRRRRLSRKIDTSCFLSPPLSALSLPPLFSFSQFIPLI